MELEEIKRLLESYKSNTCSEAEIAQLYNWFSDDVHKTDIVGILTNDLESINDDLTQRGETNLLHLLEHLHTQVKPTISPVNENEQPNFISLVTKYFWRVAVVILFFFVAGGIATYYIVPSVIQSNTVCEIKVPLGAKSQVILPDGSIVWINAGSTLKYNSDNTNRTVILDGEAYFKVAKNEKMPFIVNTSDIQITALGTEFNVKSYTGDGFVVTTLIEGKVAIRKRAKQNFEKSTILLTPNQKATYLKHQNSIFIDNISQQKNIIESVKSIETGKVYVSAKIDPAPEISWRDNRLIIKGETMESLAIKLERKYDVKIQFIDKQVGKYRFTGTLDDETFEQVLDVIKLTSPIEYSIDGKQVVIYEDKQLEKKFKEHLKNQ